MNKFEIFYINLQKDELRREKMESEFSRLHIDANRIDAIWWCSVSSQDASFLFNAELNEKQYYKPLSNGEKGCYSSHISAWRKLLAGTSKAMVVLEDDICLKDDFFQVVKQICSLDIEWDMVKLIGREGSEKISRSSHLLNEYNLIEYKKIPSCTTGYVISRKGAEKLIGSRLPFGRPVDIDLRFFWENDMKILGVHPAVISLSDSSNESSIWAEREKNSFRMKLKKIKMKLHLEFMNFVKTNKFLKRL